MSRTVVVLAAGEGKRMRSALPKVLHPLLGRTMIGHALAAAQPLDAQHTLVVVGHGAEQVTAHLAQIAPQATPVLQERQLGTGHAVRVALAAVPEVTGTVVVLNGDLPLLRSATLAALVEAHESANAAATLLTAHVADPAGLGRVVRGPARTQHAPGDFERIVEERDASPQEREIHEINAGAYAFQAGPLRDALDKLSTDNDQGEEYLTHVFGALLADGHRVVTSLAADAAEALSANDRAQLATLRAALRDRINGDWMRSGVTLIDPATTWIDVTVSLARDAVLEPNTQLHGTTVIGEGAVVGPDTTLTDVYVEHHATVVRTHGSKSRIGAGASVGPFAYLRPGTSLGDGGKIGTFVETKNADIGSGTKVPHLSYVGDATIGEHTNIGAATVFVNYDGIAKHRTVVGSHARTGADNMFVAPVEVGDGAYTGAGTVVRRAVPPGALSYSSAPQKIIEGWVETRRPGTAAADAAARARRAGDATDGSGGTAAGETASGGGGPTDGSGISG